MNKANSKLQQEFSYDEVKAYRALFDQQIKELDTEVLTQKFSDAPQLFLHTAKTTKSFLLMGDEPFAQLCQIVSTGSESCRLEVRAWERIRAKEMELWQEVEAECSNLRDENRPLADVLLAVVFWLEDYRWKKGFDTGIEEGVLRAIYQTFVPLYLSTKHSSQDVSPQDIHTHYLSILREGEQSAIKLIKAVDPLLNAIASWREYYDGVVMLYCFDRTSYIEEESDEVYLCQSKEDYTAWAQDGNRYTAIKNYYGLDSDEQLPQATRSLFKDAGLTNKHRLVFYYNMASCCAYCRENYTECLIPFCLLSDSSPIGAMQTLFAPDQLRGYDILPFGLHTQESFNELMNYALQTEGQDFSDDLKRLSFEIRADFEFDRFKSFAYDAYKKPFIKLGENTYFSPMIFFADIDWTIQALANELDYLNSGNNNLSRKQEQREQSKFLEKFLSDTIQREIKSITKVGSEEALRDALGKDNGDIDLFFEDENTTLLIQVKGSKLRLDQEEACCERDQSEQKAYEQIRKAEAYLPNTEFKPEGKIVRWVVSTSFEGINRKPNDDNGINKVNYFELLAILRSVHLSSLDDLIKAVNSDYILNNYLGEDPSEREAFRTPL